MSAAGRLKAINQETGGLVVIIDGADVLNLTSADCPWKFAQLEVTATGPYETPPLMCTNTLLGMCRTTVPMRAEFDVNGRIQRSVFFDHSMSIIPIGDVGRWRALDPHQVNMLSIENSLLTDIACDAGLFETVQLPFAPAIPEDAFMKGAMLALYEEAESSYVSGQLYGDAIITALAAHLLTKYNLNKKLVDSKGGLSARTLRKIVDYLHESYQSDVSLPELSEMAHMSPYHFSRLFKKSTGMTPHQYLIHYRVRRAKELIKSGKLSLKQVAKAVGFWDASHLNRHFKRIYGVSASD